MKKRAFAVLLLACSLACFADDGKPGALSFAVEGLRVKWWGIVPTGGDIRLGYNGLTPFANAPTEITLRVGGAYEYQPLTRSELDGTPLSATALSEYDALDFQEEILLGQMIPISASRPRLLEAWAAYRNGLWTDVGPEVTSVFPDRNLLALNAFAAGLSLRGATSDAHGLKTGVEGDLAFEAAPKALNTIGGAAYGRVTGLVSGWLPLWDAEPDKSVNLFSVQADGRLMAEYCDGESVPLPVMQFFGGRVKGQSLGEAVRGYGWGQFDAKFKAVANAEIRLLGPALFGQKNLMPVLYGYYDAGFYSGYGECPAADASKWGLPMSFGAGFALNCWGIAEPTLRVSFPLTGESRGVLSPVIEAKLNLHY